MRVVGTTGAGMLVEDAEYQGYDAFVFSFSIMCCRLD